jgi:hypothetical protein
VVGGDQFLSTVIWLTALDFLLSVGGTTRQFVGPVHPVNACINMVVIGSSYVQDARNPLTIPVFMAISFIVCDIFMVDG